MVIHKVSKLKGCIIGTVKAGLISFNFNPSWPLCSCLSDKPSFDHITNCKLIIILSAHDCRYNLGKMIQEKKCSLYMIEERIKLEAVLLIWNCLYTRTPSKLLCPVRFIMICLSTPARQSLVAIVTLNEWFVLWPCMPAMVHKCNTFVF